VERDTGTRRIAVVAIHGVGDHAQFTTGREIGDLLSNLECEPTNTPRHTPFTEVMKRINVRPVIVPEKADIFDWTNHELQKNTWGPMDGLASAVFKNENGALPKRITLSTVWTTCSGGACQ
jgi:hypothetical protein